MTNPGEEKIWGKRRTRDMDHMRDDLAPLSTTTRADSVDQHERGPGRVCCGAPCDTYNAEVRHG